MATITVKNIPDDVYERLKATANANRRSINSEIIVCIEKSVSSRRNTKAILAEARRLREKTAEYKITDKELTKAKSEGRL